ncbi:MAG: alpha/beta hydrolase, partial [Gemmatimonadaceae bacterium]|nr:alpha/beta hydrolase [Acetobacteraceae bacterium]
MWPSSNAAPPVPPQPDRALIAGIAAYRRHPWQRNLPDPACLWQEGGSRLLDFGPPGAPPVLFVPSLVNRAYVLDIAPGRSMMRWLAAHGVRPLLLDWGWPGSVERGFTLSDYIAGRLLRAVSAVGPAVLAGYCMGGLLAAAAA